MNPFPLTFLMAQMVPLRPSSGLGTGGKLLFLDFFLIVAAALLLAGGLFLWAKFFYSRRRRKRVRKSRHRTRSGAETANAGEPASTESGTGGRRKRRRRRRREHRPRNPTLAETGGLPPVRPTEGGSEG